VQVDFLSISGRFRKLTTGLLSLCFIAVVACGGASSSGSASSSSGGTSSGSTTDGVVGGNVTEISLTDSSAQVSLSDITASDEIVLALHSYNTGTSSEAFTVGTSENARFLTDENLMPDEVIDEEEGDTTESFHEMLSEQEQAIDPNAMAADGDLPGHPTPRFASTGSTKTFKVLNTFSGSGTYDTVTATLRFQNDSFEFYVDNRDSASIDDSDLATLASGFVGVLPQERALFGHESDVDNNGKFAVLFTHTVNALASGSGGIVTGFFYALDLFDVADYPISNETEVYYSFVPDPSGTYGSAVSKSFAMSNILPGVLVHEYQHMINFNEHYFVSGGSAESSFLNEGLSHLAEDIYSINTSNYMEETGIENPARVKGFLENISNICFSCGSSLNQRGGSYLFLRYLYEQAQLGHISGSTDGADLIGHLLVTDLRGTENIAHAAYGASPPSDAFKTLLGRFSLAVYLSNTGETTNEQLQFTGINLRTAQDDNRGTVLNGPAVQTVSSLPFTDTILGSSMSYIQIDGQTIINNGGVLPLTFSADASFGGYLIR
jgi:hypothetical protein